MFVVEEGFMRMLGLSFNKTMMRKLIGLVLIFGSLSVLAQTKPDRDLSVTLNENGSHFINATFTNQVWLRYNQSNPGTTVNGFSKPETFDIGLRRLRFQLYGKVHDKVFVYTQFGVNNFGYNSERKPGLFFHDAIAEYYITSRSLQVGAGLTAWNGFARYSSASISSCLAFDLPLYQQTTADANDQFLRKLSIYAKGKLGKLDYRLIVSNPMVVGPAITTVKSIHTQSDFSYAPPKVQTAAYLMYQFLDEESNLTPYNTGSYLGKKNVFNIGAGFQFQPDAMWHYGNAATKDTVTQNMLNMAIDVFYDHPIGTNGSAITAYGAFSRTDYGKNYLRNNGPMNPGAGGSSLNGGGSAYPTYGTGNTLFVEAGYLLPNPLPGKWGRLQPYGECTVSTFDALNENMVMWGAGANWLIDGQKSKLTLGYQNRPVFDQALLEQTERKSMLVLQFQIAI
jgi:hypothetical protein